MDIKLVIEKQCGQISRVSSNSEDVNIEIVVIESDLQTDDPHFSKFFMDIKSPSEKLRGYKLSFRRMYDLHQGYGVASIRRPCIRPDFVECMIEHAHIQKHQTEDNMEFMIGVKRGEDYP